MLHSDTLRQLMPVELGATHDADLMMKGAALDAVESGADALRAEMFPETALLTLSDWERVLGIVPSPDDTVATRQARCLVRTRARGRLDAGYFLETALALGVDLTIEELEPTKAGGMEAGGELQGDDCWFVWKVTVTASPGADFKAGASVAGEALGGDLAAVVKEIFNDLKPAHTFCLFQQ